MKNSKNINQTSNAPKAVSRPNPNYPSTTGNESGKFRGNEPKTNN